VPVKPTAVGSYIFAGGFTLGVRRHFKVLAHLEDGPYGVASMRAAQPDVPVFDDPDRWPSDDLDDVDFLYGNPPCAAWSPLGPRSQRGPDAWRTDPRVECARTFFNLFELLRPAVWAWESVPQAYTRGRGLVNWFVDRAATLGYSTYAVLHNAMYLGAYQHRKRFFLVASKVEIDWCPRWAVCPPALTALEMLPVDRRGEEPTSVTDYWHPDFIRMVKPGDALRAVYPRWLKRVQKRYGKRLTEDLRRRVAPKPNFGNRRVPLDKPCGAVVDAFLIHPTELRYLTLGELLHLSGFPTDYPLVGSTFANRAHQICRGVLPPVGEWLAGNVARALRMSRPAPEQPTFLEINLYSKPGDVRELTTED
jgi:site-specific DNA-cytosine methylase